MFVYLFACYRGWSVRYYDYQLMLESVIITGIVSISLDNYVACLEAIHTMLFSTFLAGFCKIREL